jgi:hypothetical protein
MTLTIEFKKILPNLPKTMQFCFKKTNREFLNTLQLVKF